MPTTVCSPQSYLFVPGSRLERFDKAPSSGADAITIDLEDAVEPAAKDAAREIAAAWVSRKRQVLVRINRRGTPWFEQDAKLGALDAVAGIVLPKAERATDVSTAISFAHRRVPVYPLIESAASLYPFAESIDLGLQRTFEWRLECTGERPEVPELNRTIRHRLPDQHRPENA